MMEIQFTVGAYICGLIIHKRVIIVSFHLITKKMLINKFSLDVDKPQETMYTYQHFRNLYNKHDDAHLSQTGSHL